MRAVAANKNRLVSSSRLFQKGQTSHPPNPGAPRRALSQARPRRVRQAEVEVKVERRQAFFSALTSALAFQKAGGLFNSLLLVQLPGDGVGLEAASCR